MDGMKKQDARMLAFAVRESMHRRVIAAVREGLYSVSIPMAGMVVYGTCFELC
jgi:hypothetical protein